MTRGLVIVTVCAAWWPAALAAQGHDDPAVLQAPPRGSTEEAPRHQHVVSLHLVTLGTGGLALQYERIPDGSAFTFVVGAGYRAGAGDDFSSTTLALGGGARWWPWADESDDDRRTGGFFVEARLDVGWTNVTDEIENRVVGNTIAIAESLHVGWRLVLFDRVEVTPTFGFALQHEIDPDGLLSPSTEGKLQLGLLLGVLF